MGRHLDGLTFEFGPFHLPSTNTQRSGLLEDGFFHDRPQFVLAEDCQKNGWPIFFHLNRGQVHIEVAEFKRRSVT